MAPQTHHYITHEVACMDADSLLIDVIDTMKNLGISSVVLTEHDEPVGIFTERDIMLKLDFHATWSFATLRVREYMSAPLKTLDEGAGYSEILAQMLTQGIRHLPLVRDGKAVGIITLRDLLKHHVDYLSGLLDEIIQSLSQAIGEKDPYTAGHMRRVAAVGELIAQQMGHSEDFRHGLQLSAMVHDIGKLSVPLEILCKPGKLSSLEFDIIKEHSRAGYEILKSIDFQWNVASIVHQHHERIDGSGYPLGLSESRILPESRILAVADVLEAIVSHRPYRPALGIEIAVDELKKKSGTHFDPAVVQACLKIVESPEMEAAFK